MFKKIVLLSFYTLCFSLPLQSGAGEWNSKDLLGPFSSWGISPDAEIPSINLLAAWKKFQKKKDIVVAVIDTGVDNTHPFISSNMYTIEGKTSLDNYGIDFTKKRSSRTKPEDKHGHGTHIAGIIKSVFPDVKLLVLKYLDPHASEDDNLKASIEALRYAVDHNVDIINYSGGGPAPDENERKILKEAERKGILVIAAAGNEQNDLDNKKKGFYPASYGFSNIVTVTAHDQTIQVLSSSNYGKNGVDIAAPGARIRSSLPGGRSGYLTGTSQATAFVTGVAALIKAEFPKFDYGQIKKIIRESAIKVPALADKCSSGGRLSAKNALEVATTRDADNVRQVAQIKP